MFQMFTANAVFSVSYAPPMWSNISTIIKVMEDIPYSNLFVNPTNCSVEIRQSSPCIIMDMTYETLITICWELYLERIRKSLIAQRLGKHHQTIRLWIVGITDSELITFLS